MEKLIRKFDKLDFDVKLFIGVAMFYVILSLVLSILEMLLGVRFA